MVNALPGEPTDSIPVSLAEGAMSLYSRVLDGSGGREDAILLLAADALLTHAFQAQAELAPERMLEFVDLWSGRATLSALLQ
jgi:hypothetical protein